MELVNKDVTDKIIKAFYKVYTELGYGFLEKVYLNALYFELILMGFSCEKQKPIKVYYLGHLVGEYYADIIVNDCVIIELKATEIEVGLLLNFGKQPEFRRKFFTNDRKKIKSV